MFQNVISYRRLIQYDHSIQNCSIYTLHFILQQRGTPPLRPPPRPQAKTCPPISRVFKRRQELFAAQAVTFLDSGESSSLRGTPLQSNEIYDSSNKLSYFEQVSYIHSETGEEWNFNPVIFQAFTIEEKIGAGCFGTVYRVRSKEDGKLYAVSFLSK